MWSDLRFAWRYLRHHPGFTLLAIVSLGVAIGVNSAMFSVVHGFLLRSAVERDPERYVGVFTATPDAARRFRPFSHAEFLALRSDRSVFADVSAVAYSQVALGEGPERRRAFAFVVTENFFALADAQPAIGRFFTAEETAPHAARPVVVASHALWQQAGGRADFVGSTLRVNGRPLTVVGVAAPGFSGASPLLAPEIWLPLGWFAEVQPAFGQARATADLLAADNFSLALFGRLQPGLTRDSSRPLLPVLARRLAAAAPPERAGTRELILARPFGIAPEPPADGAFGPVTSLTLGLSVLVLVVACLNLSNLLLARGATRSAEIATRLALGATPARIVRQLLAEGVLLGLAGGALGLLLCAWCGQALAHVLAERVASFGFVVATSFRPDGTVLSVTLLAGLLASVAFSLGPALLAARRDLATDLKSGASGAVAGAGRGFWQGRNLLLIAQAAGSFVLLFAAGLFGRAAAESAAPPRGFTPPGRVIAELDFSLATAAPAEPPRRLATALERIAQLPGVAAAGAASLVPYVNEYQVVRARPASERGGHGVVAAFAAVTPDYLASLGVPLVRGRAFSPAETLSRELGRTCQIDETLATRLFPQSDPIGQSIALQGGPGDQLAGEFTIVGIVASHSQDVADRRRPFPRVFVPLAQVDHPVWFLSVLGSTRTDAATETLAATLARELRLSDPDLPVLRVRPHAAVMADNFSLWQAELAAGLFGLFGGIAAALAAVGIYGVTAFAVARRTREFGVRLALGASAPDIFRLVLTRGARQLGVAAALGSVISLGVGRALAGFVPEVPAFDPGALALAAAGLLLAATPALLLPARRATRVDPLVALRAE
jgi:predicted permease